MSTLKYILYKYTLRKFTYPLKCDCIRGIMLYFFLPVTQGITYGTTAKPPMDHGLECTNGNHSFATVEEVLGCETRGIQNLPQSSVLDSLGVGLLKRFQC